MKFAPLPQSRAQSPPRPLVLGAVKSRSVAAEQTSVRPCFSGRGRLTNCADQPRVCSRVTPPHGATLLPIPLSPSVKGWGKPERTFGREPYQSSNGSALSSDGDHPFSGTAPVNAKRYSPHPPRWG